MGIIQSANSNEVIFPNNSTLNSVPYKELITYWWEWNLGIPNDIHPLNDYPNTERCSANQKGSVWYLPYGILGTGKVNYQCNIPFGKIIMVPISMSECDLGIEGFMNDKQLINCAHNINTSPDQIELSVDRVKIDTSKLVAPIMTEFFNVTYTSNPIDIFGSVNPGTYKAIAEGYVLFLHDLPLGEHTVDTKVVDLLKGKESPEFTETNYDIIIQ